MAHNFSKLCFFYVCFSQNQAKIKDHAIVIPQLKKLFPTFTMSCELADPNCHTPAQMDMVIGSNLIPLILQKVCDNILAQKLYMDGYF